MDFVNGHISLRLLFFENGLAGNLSFANKYDTAMSEIKLTVEDKYLRAFLDFLRTLNYISVQEVAGPALRQNGAAASASDILAQNLAPGDPLFKAIRPLRKGLTAQDLIEEQGYRSTDWNRLEQLAKDMDIPQPLEDLLAQLTV